jgi:hypothetical protein
MVRGTTRRRACLYIAQEHSYITNSVLDVKANRNTLQNCGSLNTGHSAAMVFSDDAEANNNITLLSNDIIQNGQDGIRYYGAQTNIRIEHHRSAADARTSRSAKWPIWCWFPASSFDDAIGRRPTGRVLLRRGQPVAADFEEPPQAKPWS